MDDRGRGKSRLPGDPCGREASGAPSPRLCWQTMELFRLSLGCICLLPWLEGKFLLLRGSWKVGRELFPQVLTCFPAEALLRLQSSEPTSCKRSACWVHFKGAFKMGLNAGERGTGWQGAGMAWPGTPWHHAGRFYKVLLDC